MVFDKVNSGRVYSLERQDGHLNLTVEISAKEKEKSSFLQSEDQTHCNRLQIEKLIVLPVDDEIKVIIGSFLQVFEETGFIESAPKCYARVSTQYAISNGRIRLVQRVL